MARVGRWIGLPATLLMLLVGPAQAKKDDRIQLLVLDPQSAFMEPGQLAELGRMLRAEGADYRHLNLVAAPEANRLHKLAGCHDNSNRCLKSMGRAVSASRVLYSQIQKLPGRYMVSLRLIDTRTGKVLKTSRQRGGAGQAAALKALRAGWQSIFGRLVESLITVGANVSDARIYLDGRPVGETPLALREKLTAGVHVLRAIHPDYLPATRKVRIRARNPKLRVRFNLKIKPAADIPPVALVAAVPGVRGGKGARPGGKPTADGAEPGGKLKGDDTEPGGKLKGDDAEPGGKLKGDDTEPGGKLKGDDTEPGSKPEGDGAKPEDDDAKPEAAGSAAAKQPAPGDGAGKGGGNAVAALPPPADAGKAKPPYLPGDEQPGGEDDGEAGPVYEKWWFWTAVGAAVAAGVVTGAVLGADSGGGNGIPSGKGRLTVEF